MQISPVNHEVWKAIASHRLRPQVKQRPSLPGIPKTNFLARRLAGNFFQCRSESEGEKRPGAIGAELDARAKSLQFRRLLENANLEPAF